MNTSSTTPTASSSPLSRELSATERTSLAEIRSLHGEIMGAARTTLDKAIRIGALLTEQKASMRHGKWLPWMEANLPFSRQTADNYRRIFDNREKLPTVGNLELTDAYRLLGAPAETTPAGEKLTAAQIREVASEQEIKLASSAIRAEKTARRMDARTICVQESAKLPDAKFRVIYADPPWKYGDQLTEDYGPTKFHYPSMSIAELCSMPIKGIIEPDSVLFLWVTSPMLCECIPVIGAWGFEYKTSIVWWKQAHNMGHYVSNQHEFLLICTRGSCTPDIKELLPSVLVVKRGKHSEKPNEAREMIETLYPHGKRLELFARKQSPGWAVFGNQIGGAV